VNAAINVSYIIYCTCADALQYNKRFFKFWKRSRGHCRDMASIEFENSGRRHLDFKTLDIVTADKINRVNVNHHTKFLGDRSNRCWHYSNSTVIKITAIRLLEFLWIPNFNCRYGSHSKYVSHCHISHWSVKPLPRYGCFSIFQNGGRPLSWIRYTPVWTTDEKYLVDFVTVQNLVWIGAVVSIICIFVIFWPLGLKTPLWGCFG